MKGSNNGLLRRIFEPLRMAFHRLQSSARSANARSRKRGNGAFLWPTVAVFSFLAAVVILYFVGARLGYYGYWDFSSNNDRGSLLKYVQMSLSILGGMALFYSIVVANFRASAHIEQAKSLSKQVKLQTEQLALAQREQERQQQRDLEELFCQAVTQLGGSTTSMQIGALYTLGFLMETDPIRFRATCLQCISAAARLSAANYHRLLPDDEILGLVDPPKDAFNPDLDGEKEIMETAFRLVATRSIGGHANDPDEIDLSCLSVANLHIPEANLMDVRLERAELCNVRLPKSNLQRSSFVAANLRNADISGSFVSGCDFSHAQLHGANLTGVTTDRNERIPQVVKFGFGATRFRRPLRPHDGVNLRRADLTHADLRESKLLKADFFASSVEQTEFDGAIIDCENRLEHFDIGHQQIETMASFTTTSE